MGFEARLMAISPVGSLVKRSEMTPHASQVRLASAPGWLFATGFATGTILRGSDAI
jgi:hypothetical protein